MNSKTKRTLAGLSGVMMMQAGVTAQAAVDGVEVQQAEQQVYDEVANVQGAFEFNQDVVSPRDDIFNLFGNGINIVGTYIKHCIGIIAARFV